MDPFTIIRLGENRQHDILDQAAQDREAKPVLQTLQELSSGIITAVEKAVQPVAAALKKQAAANNNGYIIDPCIEQPETCVEA